MAERVAIIASACRFPGEANSPAKLWELLKEPRDVLCAFPKDSMRLNLQSFYHQNGEHHGSTDVQNKGYLLSEDIRLFDASFFRISPPEAAAMDPQQRILLETVYEALESAGLPLDQLQGSLTSVWAGLMNGDFADIQARDLETLPTQHATGTHRSILSNRISYFLDVRAPSMTIDTACSSSLVALHQAVQSLRSGESDMAIVAGVNLILDPVMYVAESKLHMLSPDSRSRMWDKDANGYARGEGFAAIVLQRVGDAVRDRNHIECIVRGTAVNSDGRGKGAITVPSAAAQTALIKQAYRDAGLDARRDRCHYFEAHGTGTQAGDPVEAQAIRDAFFLAQNDGDDDSEVPPGKLLVGSIKTVVGHLEGCAGLAGVLKGSLALQHRTIPPNMLFSELNPAIVPFYDRLEIAADQARPWPAVQPDSPLRVSVNSFGFGGTNAHVVLESYQDGEEQEPAHREQLDDERFVGPLVFSANSQESLVKSVQAHAQEIRSNKLIELSDLAWTLQFRRTYFGNSRATFSGATRQKLLSNMDAFVADAMAATTTTTTALADQRDMPPTRPGRFGDDGPALLGIFTGQGAQWASMGRSLMRHCRLFRESIARCEEALATLGPDAPAWSLAEELVADDAASRIAEAALSQPLCTAVQIGLVDLLRASGVRFRAVVGHSSGEIAAAYAAGILPRTSDAIRIAYYRGLHTKLAAGPAGNRRGAMLAAGLSWDDASRLCARPEYAGRISVAADNSPTSVTLSGDADAVEEVEAHLTVEGTFARKLKVDMAYHSQYMEACAPAYLASLRACEIQVQQPPGGCVWVSSVRGDIDSVLADQDEGEDEGSGLQAVRDQYWVDNLTNPVLFGPAIECALWRAGPFDAVVEVGPHPALKGPTMQVMKASLGASLPYVGVMRRGNDEVEAFSSSLGYLWEQLGPAASIDFDCYRRAFCATLVGAETEAEAKAETRPPRLVKGLPAYCWDHAKVHWRESRFSRNFRLADRACNHLIGRRAPDDMPGLLRWRNVLRLDEMPWVKGHVFQGQVVLPGTSYVSAMIEAIQVLANALPVKLVELCDVVLHRAVVLREHSSCELTTNLRVVHKTSHVVSAEFSFSAAPSDSDAAPETTCSGRVELHLGGVSEGDAAKRQEKQGKDGEEALLSSLSQPPPNLSAVDVDLFYSSLKKVGLAFSGLFRGTKSAQRSLGYASTSASWDNAQGEMVMANQSSSAQAFSIHPAVLDVALHALFAAFASPATEQMWTPYLPVAIRRVSIVPRECPGSRVSTTTTSSSPTGRTLIDARISAQVTKSSPRGFEGDVQLVLGDSDRVAVQVEGVAMRAMGDQAGSADGDRVLFSHIKWDSDISTGVDKVTLERDAPAPGEGDDSHLVEAMGRTALYYYRTLLEELAPGEVEEAAWHHRMFVQSAQHWVDEVRAGRHPTIKREWLEDTKEAVWRRSEIFRDQIDILLMRAVGENLVSIIRGEKQPLEVMMEHNMLTRFYVEGHGLDPMNDHIARAVSQISHRYPRANILEIGAGTGGTTRKVLRTIGNAYGLYTFTDISPGFFERAADKFSAQVRQRSMTFQVLDIEKDVVGQGFSEGAYDVIVAANVLHATEHLQDTMRQVRRLLKPGGYLVMMEITGDLLRLGFILGVLPGWWLGPQIGDEGRQWAPGISTGQWDDLLRRTGFSGVDHAASDSPVAQNHYLSMLVTQAVDDRVDLLRSPLMHLPTLPPLQPDVAKLWIIGGETPAVARLAQDLKSSLAPWAGTTIEMASNVEQLVGAPQERVAAICLTELDQSLFGRDSSMTAAKLVNLQAFLQRARSVLWVTAGCRGPNPQANMFAGLARAVRAEQRDINLQLLDVGARPEDADISHVTEAFMRLALADQPGFLDAPDRQPLLWTTETELALDAGSLLIPRLIPDEARNERYNAARRIVTKEVDVGAEAEWDFEVEGNDGVLSLAAVERTVSRCLEGKRSSHTAGHVLIDVQLTVPLVDPEHRHFLCYGSIDDGSSTSGTTSVLAVTQSHASVALVSVDGIIPVPLPAGEFPFDSPARHQASKVLEAVAGQLVARSLVPRVPRRGPVLLHEPAEALVRAMASCRLWNGRQVYYAASSLPSVAVPKGWISTDPHVLGSSVRQMLPADLAAVVDFSARGASSKRDFQPYLPDNCVVIRFEPAFLETDSESLGQAYADAIGLVDSEAASSADHEVRVIPRDTLPGRPSSSVSFPSVVDWCARSKQNKDVSSSNKVTVQVKALSAAGLFSSSKTHLMVGLNGDLGQSICGFMARNGARHFAITSRGGEVNPEWLEMMQRQGVHVGVYAMDVTSKQDIRSTLAKLHNDGMPPVGGVANGALVLRDKLFLNMDAESMNDTLRPKVTGSQNLDEVFSGELDYFVLFSSLATMAGNAGQSNYHAANMFMAGLAANRRMRGLAASVMHVGVVADAGYVTRQGRQLLEHLRKQFFMGNSESDAHQQFAEIVLASPPDSGLPPDLCMGLEPFPDRPDEADLVRPSWVRDHRLSHFVFVRPDEDQQAAGLRGGSKDGEALPLNQRIDGTTSVQAAEAMLQEAFSAKLETLLQLDPGSVNVHAPLLALGFDSLLAVETRTWFLREISVDVPVLRFLGGDTVHEICADAAAQYLALHNTTASDASDGADTKVTTKLSVSEEPVASSSSSASSTATTPPTSSPTTSARASVDLASTQDLKPEAPLITSRTEAGSDARSGADIQTTQACQPQKQSRNTFRVERLSHLQSRLWSLGQALDDPAASNIAVSYNIKGPLDATRLREALAKVVAHHPSLRTCFYVNTETGEPLQRLLPQVPSSALYLKQVRAATLADGVIEQEFSALKQHEWDLGGGETFGATLVHVADEDKYVLIFGYPLLIMDGVSWFVFLRDLGRAYSMQPLSRQDKLCIDAAAEQRRAVESMSGTMQDAVSFWQRLYAELPEELPFLPFASVTHRQPLRRFEVYKSIRTIDSHLVAKIKDASKALRATPFHFYLSAAQALFAKLLPDLPEICMGVFDANRPGDGSLSDVVGYFVNVLPLRFRFNDLRQASFAEMVRRTSTHELEARRYGQVPFDVILDGLNVPRNASVSPLCQVAFNYRVGAMADVDVGDCRLALDTYSDVQNNRYDLSFGLFETAAGSYAVTITCKNYIYDRDATEILIGAYVHLLDALASDASRTLSEYALTEAATEALDRISLKNGQTQG